MDRNLSKIIYGPVLYIANDYHRPTILLTFWQVVIDNVCLIEWFYPFSSYSYNLYLNSYKHIYLSNKDSSHLPDMYRKIDRGMERNMGYLRPHSRKKTQGLYIAGTENRNMDIANIILLLYVKTLK